MRFRRYIRESLYVATPLKLKAAERAVQKEKEAMALFPQFVRHQSGAERLAAAAERVVREELGGG